MYMLSSVRQNIDQQNKMQWNIGHHDFGARFCSSLYQMASIILLMICIVVLPSTAKAGSYEDFFQAIKADNGSAITALIQRGFDPNTMDENDSYGLIIALQENAMHAFSALVNAPGIDLDLATANGDTALMIAAYKANKPAVVTLLDKGAAVNKQGWSPLHYAAASGDNEIVKMLMNKSAELDALSPNGTTPMMMAARNGHILTVKILSDAGADASLKNQHGMSAIDFAKLNGNTDIVEGLSYRLKKAGKL